MGRTTDPPAEMLSRWSCLVVVVGRPARMAVCTGRTVHRRRSSGGGWREIAAVTAVGVLALWALGFGARAAALGSDVDGDAPAGRGRGAPGVRSRGRSGASPCRHRRVPAPRSTPRSRARRGRCAICSRRCPPAWRAMPGPRPLRSTWPTARRLRGRAALPTSRPTASAPAAKTGSCWSRCWGCGWSTSARWTGVSARWWSPNAASAPRRPQRRWRACAAAGPNPYRLNTRWATRRPGGCERRRPHQPRSVALRDRRARTTARCSPRSSRTATWRARATSGPRPSGGRCSAVIAVAVLFAAGAVLDWRAMTRAAQPGARGDRPGRLRRAGAGGSAGRAGCELVVAAAVHGRHLRVVGRAPAAVVAAGFPSHRRRADRAWCWWRCSGSRPRAAGGAAAGPSPSALATASAGALLAGIAAAFVLQGHAWVLRDTVAHSTRGSASLFARALQRRAAGAAARADRRARRGRHRAGDAVPGEHEPVAGRATVGRAGRARRRVGASDRDLVGRAGRRSVPPARRCRASRWH